LSRRRAQGALFSASTHGSLQRRRQHRPFSGPPSFRAAIVEIAPGRGHGAITPIRIEAFARDDGT